MAKSPLYHGETPPMVTKGHGTASLLEAGTLARAIEFADGARPRIHGQLREPLADARELSAAAD